MRKNKKRKNNNFRKILLIILIIILISTIAIFSFKKITNYQKQLELNKEKEQINNVSLKIVNKSFSKIKGCVKPNLKSSGYEIIINLAPFTKMNEDNKKFYLYYFLCHIIF